MPDRHEPNQPYPRGKPMDEARLRAIIKTQINNATGQDGGEISAVRRRLLEYYHGENFGDEIKGRSQVVSTDVSDMVESVMPDTAPDASAEAPEAAEAAEPATAEPAMGPVVAAMGAPDAAAPTSEPAPADTSTRPVASSLAGSPPDDGSAPDAETADAETAVAEAPASADTALASVPTLSEPNSSITRSYSSSEGSSTRVRVVKEVSTRSRGSPTAATTVTATNNANANFGQRRLKERSHCPILLLWCLYSSFR